MMRTVWAVLAGLLCALLGLRRAWALRHEADRLHRWGQMLAHLALLMREGLPLPEALCKVAIGHGTPDELLRKAGESLRENPLLPLEETIRAEALPLREGETLLRMMERLGRGSLEDRLLALEQGQQEISLMAKSSAESAEKDAKLYQTLGITGGVCIALYLL